MNELTQEQYRDLFGCTNSDPDFLQRIHKWNLQALDGPVRLQKRLNAGPVPSPIIYREQLPASLESVLADNEVQGKRYTEGFDPLRHIDTRKPYTVLLLYPDYLTDEYGSQTWLSHVSAIDPRHAVLEAQREAFDNYTDGDDPHGCPEDFACLLVIAGHHDDLSP